MRTLIACALAMLAGCGSREAESEKPADSKLVVFAAASLREGFTELGESLKKTHPGLEVQFNFAGSQELRTQIEQGAQADVFASADLKHMAALEADKRVLGSKPFARNEPVVIAASANPAPKSFAELASAERIVLGVPEVPIGRYSLEVLDRASQSLGADFRKNVEAHVVSRELNVRQVLAKVSLGEAGAGIVYRTDVKNAQNVRVIEIPRELNAIAVYPIATLAAAPHPALAREFVELVLGPTGQKALGEQGFLPP